MLRANGRAARSCVSARGNSSHRTHSAFNVRHAHACIAMQQNTTLQTEGLQVRHGPQRPSVAQRAQPQQMHMVLPSWRERHHIPLLYFRPRRSGSLPRMSFPTPRMKSANARLGTLCIEEGASAHGTSVHELPRQRHATFTARRTA